jgi:AAA+ ATPase superfamily predicted ATPase
MQRQMLAEALSVRFPGFGEAVYPSWHSFFQALSAQARLSEWHGPVIFDEFPYLVASDGSLPGTFQKWVDAECSGKGLLIVISGSSQQMMQGLTLNSSSPLYGRAQELLHLQPLPAGLLRPALGLEDALDVIRAYSVWGGVPRYWQAAESHGSELDAALDQLVFHSLGVFHEEPNHLLQMEVPSALSLRPYLDAIGFGAHRSSEIASRLQQPATDLARPLSRLIELGLVKREVPFGESERSSRKSLYRISDPFCDFWFRVIAPRRALFENAPQGTRLMLWRKYAEAIFSTQWEELARQNVNRVASLAAELPSEDCWLPARRWWQENRPEWDIVTTNLTGDTALLGEVKWSDQPFHTEEIQRLAQMLLNRDAPPGLPRKILRLLVLPAIAPDASCPPSIRLVTGDDILQATLEK